MNPYHRPVMMEGMLKHDINLRSLQFELEELLVQLRESPAITISLIGPSGVGKSYLLSLLADPGKAWMGVETPHLLPDAERCLFVLVDGGNAYVAREIEAGHFFGVFFDQLRASLLGFALVYQNGDTTLSEAKKTIRRASTIVPRSYQQLWAALCEDNSTSDTPDRLILERFRAKLTHWPYRTQYEHLEDNLQQLGKYLCPNPVQLPENDGRAPTTEEQFDELCNLLNLVVRLNFRVVFLIDEFDALVLHLENNAPQRGEQKDEQKDEQKNKHIRQLRQLVGQYSFVIASSRALSTIVPDEFKAVSFEILLRALRPVQLDMLPLDDAQRIIEKVPEWAESLVPDNMKKIRFSASDIDFILEVSGTHLELIRRNCEQLFSWMSRRDDIAPGQDLLTDAEKPYYRAKLRPLFHDMFAGIWHDLSERERTTLYTIASGSSEVLPPPNRFPLSRLIELGYVVYRGANKPYELFAGLFQDYVLDHPDMPQSQVSEPGHSISHHQERSEHPQNGTSAPAVADSLVGLERNLFRLLNANSGKVVTRDEIAAALYSGEAEQPPRQRIDTLVSRLRSKLKDTDLTIVSHRGQGYELLSSHQK